MYILHTNSADSTENIVPIPGFTAQQSKIAIINQLSLNIFQPLNILINVMYKLAHDALKYLSDLYKFLIL